MRSKFSNGTYDVNPLVESGEYVPVYACEVEPGDLLAAYGDAEVTDVTPIPWGERVTLTLGGLDRITLKRQTTLLVKVPPPSLWFFSERPERGFGPYTNRDDAREAFQRVLGFWPESAPTRTTYKV